MDFFVVGFLPPLFLPLGLAAPPLLLGLDPAPGVFPFEVFPFRFLQASWTSCMQCMGLEPCVVGMLARVLARTTKLLSATSARVQAEQCCKMDCRTSGLPSYLVGKLFQLQSRIDRKLQWASLSGEDPCLSDLVTAASTCSVSRAW